MIDIKVILDELANLGPGWFEPDSVGPPASVIDEVQVILESLPSYAQPPGVDVDPDDGSVVLRWLSPDASRMLSLSLFGNGTVIGHLSSSPNLTRPWTIATQDAQAIRAKLADPVFLEVLEDTVY